MIHSLNGALASRKENFIVVENGGIGYKIIVNARTLESLPDEGNQVKFFCHLYVREDRLELYGFLTEKELRLFELFNSVSGIGPKLAIGLLGMDKAENIVAAIMENRPDLLTRVSGVGGKTAERIILELKNKIKPLAGAASAQQMEADFDAEEVLINLGYQKRTAREALNSLPKSIQKIEDRLKEALKILGKKI